MSFFVQRIGHPSTSRIEVRGCLPSSQWSSAKQKVSEVLQLPLESCRFIHKGKILEDESGTLHQCRIKRWDVILVQEIFHENRTDLQTEPSASSSPEIDEVTELTVESYTCDACLKRKGRKKCHTCGCHTCGTKDDNLENVVCDECDMWFHWKCLDPPLTTLPEGDWYCPSCKNDTSSIIKPGALSKNISDVTNTKSTTAKWGKGMANAGHTKSCTIVPPTHRGPIPGIEVGQAWKYRLQCGEDGVHRPLIAGIAGTTASAGAVSIVLSNGYAEDVDNGEDFIYTGSGGRTRDSKGARLGFQTSDQILAGANLHLAQTCDASISKDGAIATDWQKSRAIRVVRSHKVGKYAPADGYRYDGIYKIVKYYPQKGCSGHLVYRFEFRRDDECPAPWTDEGKRRIAKLGLEMVLPAVSMDKHPHAGTDDSETVESLPNSPRGHKRRLEESDPKIFIMDNTHNAVGETPPEQGSVHPDQPRISKTRAQKLQSQQVVLKENDSSLNVAYEKRTKSHWSFPQELEELMARAIEVRPAQESLYNKLRQGSFRNVRDFVNNLERELECPICQEFVQGPVSNPCGHISCLQCLKRSVDSDFGPRCPLCRISLVEGSIDGVDLRSKWNNMVKPDAELVQVIRYCVPDYCQNLKL